MPRKKTDQAFRESVARAFRTLHERLTNDGKIPASEISRTLGVSKQTAYQYLRGRAIPDADRLARAVQIWSLSLDYEGHSFDKSAFGPQTREPRTQARQIQLALRDLSNQPAVIRLPGTDCTLWIGVQPETLELLIGLKRTA